MEGRGGWDGVFIQCVRYFLHSSSAREIANGLLQYQDDHSIGIESGEMGAVHSTMQFVISIHYANRPELQMLMPPIPYLSNAIIIPLCKYRIPYQTSNSRVSIQTKIA